MMTTHNGAYFRNSLRIFSKCLAPSVYEGVPFTPNADGLVFVLYPEVIERFGACAGLQFDMLFLFTNSLTSGWIDMEILLRTFPSKTVANFEKSGNGCYVRCKRGPWISYDFNLSSLKLFLAWKLMTRSFVSTFTCHKLGIQHHHGYEYDAKIMAS
jgi:hypothetical protein